MRVHHHPHRLAGRVTGNAASHVRVVAQHGADTHQHRIVLTAHGVRRLAGRSRGDPLAFAGMCGDAAIQGAGQLQRHQRTALQDAHEKPSQHFTGGRTLHAFHHIHAGLAQASKAAATDARVRIGCGHHHAAHTGRDQCIGTRRGFAVMTAGFQRDVRSGTPGGLAGHGQRLGFGVRAAAGLGEALAYHRVVADQHAAYRGVRPGGA